MRDQVKAEVYEALDRYKSNLISWASGFPENEKEIIYNALYIYIKMIIEQGINRYYLFKRLEIIKAPVKDGFGMCQPLIDGRGGMTGYRIYISNRYRFKDKQLQEVFLHEMLHTMSRRDILNHKTILFHSCWKYLERYYNFNIYNIGEVEKIDQLYQD